MASDDNTVIALVDSIQQLSEQMRSFAVDREWDDVNEASNRREILLRELAGVNISNAIAEQVRKGLTAVKNIDINLADSLAQEQERTQAALLKNRKGSSAVKNYHGR